MKSLKDLSLLLALALFGAAPLSQAGEDYGSTSAKAGDPELAEYVPDEGWAIDLTMTLWTINMDGAMGVGGLVAPVDVSFKDILDSLNFVIAGTADIRKKSSPIGLLLEGSYIELGPDIDPVQLPVGTIDGITVEQVMASAALYYRVSDWDRGYVDLLGGARYMYMSNSLEFSSGGSVGGSASWVDPYLGLRAKHYVSDKVYVACLADIGGFGAGSELTWEVGGGVGYQLSKHLAMDFFYRYMSVDYDDDILFDVDMSGLFLGMKYSF